MDFFQRLINDHSFNIGVGTAGGITIASLMQVLPHVSAVLSVVWLGLRIYVLVRDEVFKKGKQNGDE